MNEKIITSLNQIIPLNWLADFGKKIGLCKRSTSRFTPLEYLQLMIMQASSHRGASLNDCCNILMNINSKAQMQPQSLWERICSQESVSFLQGVYEKISSFRFQIWQNHNASLGVLQKSFTSIIIEDSTCVSLNKKLAPLFRGAGGFEPSAGLKLHTIFNPLNGDCKILDVYEEIKTDNSLSDKILENLQSGNLIIRDLGFFNQNIFRKIGEKNAFFLSRLNSTINVYQNESDKTPINLLRMMSTRYEKFNMVEMKVYLGNSERLPIRLIIYRTPEEVANERRRKARNKGRALKPSYSQWLGFTFFITNASEKILPSNLLGTLYGLRWQIELVYKTWKSFLRLDVLNGYKIERIRSLLYSKLIVIMLMKNFHQAIAYLTAQISLQEISLMKLAKCMLDNDYFILMLSGKSNDLLKNFNEKMLKRLCKQKRTRKTTLEKIANGIDRYDILCA